FAHRTSDRPNDHREKDSEAETEKWPRECNDNLVQRRDSWQFRAVEIGFALDYVHWRELRQRHEATEGQRTKGILHSVDCFFPERLAKPDPEFLDIQTAPACCQKMPELMHDDEQIEKHDDLDHDEDNPSDVKNHD